ncbi:MAG: replication-relaxation family protein [Planctomycetaceae bacterium]|nr:replication-relaxation family protein [Planctomycetaceae bacterium]
MTNTVILSARDLSLLRLLAHTPATTTLILKASETFTGEPFHDDRRVRERLQTLAESGLIRAFPATHGVGGPINWYKLTAEGYRTVHGAEATLPHRSRFEAIPPSRFHHTQVIAEVIVHSLVAAHRDRCTVPFFYGEGEARIDIVSHTFYPDCFFQFALAGKQFNIYFEIDQSTESIDSNAEQSIRTKLLNYEAYQDSLVAWWKGQGKRGKRPFFRAVFLTRSQERAYHILWLTQTCARNADRHLVYAATQDAYLTESRVLQSPLFIDHHGRWHSLVNLHPSSNFHRAPVRLSQPVSQFASVC